MMYLHTLYSEYVTTEYEHNVTIAYKTFCNYIEDQAELTKLEKFTEVNQGKQGGKGLLWQLFLRCRYLIPALANKNKYRVCLCQT